LNDEQLISNYNKKNIARGQTFVALRRLNISDGRGKDDAGNLKGLLIRYLYELRVIDSYELDEKGTKIPDVADIDLGGADIDNVVLKDAWLRDIDLTKAWLRNGNFNKADLYGATLRGTNLTGATLTNATLTGADLRSANLTGADLTGANLTGACYIEGTAATSFPNGFDPVNAGMKAIPQDKSDPSKPNFQRCTAS
jgi:uncharacterized protein YjbI with pentapeptide repeats